MRVQGFRAGGAVLWTGAGCLYVAFSDISSG